MCLKSTNVFVALVLSINVHSALSYLVDYSVQGNEWPLVKKTSWKPDIWTMIEKALIEEEQQKSALYPMSNPFVNLDIQPVVSPNFINEASPIIRIPFEAAMIDPRTVNPSFVNTPEQRVQNPLKISNKNSVLETTKPVKNIFRNSIIDTSATRNMFTQSRFGNEAAPVITFPFKTTMKDPRTINKFPLSSGFDESTVVFDKKPQQTIDSTITNSFNEPAPFISDRFEASIIDPRTIR